MPAPSCAQAPGSTLGQGQQHCAACPIPVSLPSARRPNAMQVVEGLVVRYRAVSPLLIKVEELVAGTSTGKSSRLAG